MQVLLNTLWAIAFTLVGGSIGVGLVVVAVRWLPWMLNRLTPHLDEEREIARGNLAVAQYFGRIAAASIIGLSIVVAAAVLGGMLAGLHGLEIFVQSPPPETAPK